MPFMIRNRNFYRSLCTIGIPIALQNMITLGVNIADTVMLGQFGDATLSGASLAGQVFFVTMLVVVGLSSGGVVLISQYWGKGRVDVVSRIIGISMRMVLSLTLLIGAAAFLFPEGLLDLFSNEREVIAEGARYLKWVAFSYPLYGFSACYLVSLRAIERVKLSTATYAVSFFVNIFFNYVFMFGKLGFPNLGVIGAAIGTVLARATECLVVLTYNCFVEKDLSFGLHTLFSTEPELIGDYLRHAVPVVGSELFWGLGNTVQTAIIGNVGSVFVTANSITSVVQQLAMVMMFGIGNAAAVVLGKAIGEGSSKEEIKKMSRTLLVLALLIGVVGFCLILLLRGPIPELYDVSDAARELARSLLTRCAFITLLTSFEIICICGILRGCGDTTFALFADGGSMWLLGVPAGLVGAFLLKLPPQTVYLMLRLDMPLRIGLCLNRIKKGNFIRNLTRDTV